MLTDPIAVTARLGTCADSSPLEHGRHRPTGKREGRKSVTDLDDTRAAYPVVALGLLVARRRAWSPDRATSA